MFREMLSHRNIEILLNTDFKDVLNVVKFGRMIFTGPIDQFFDCEFGRLPYRSLHFEFRTEDVEYLQETAVVNYPNDYDYIRIVEFKHLTGQVSPKTTIATEYPVEYVEDLNDSFYPIPRAENRALYGKYLSEARRLGHVVFLGRLAEYSYYNMDQVVGRALRVFEEEIVG